MVYKYGVDITSHRLPGAKYVGLLDGLLEVAGMIMKLVTGIIPENSLRKTHQ
jgi:hypothetical protein